MGLFGNKECPICGKGIMKLNSVTLRDGKAICKDCAKVVSTNTDGVLVECLNLIEIEELFAQLSEE